MQINATDNDQSGKSTTKLIHFDNQKYQLKDTSLPIHRLTLLGDLENLKEYFSNFNEGIFNLPIKQLTVRYFSNLSILDLMTILENLPHVTFLSVDLESILEIDDQTNNNTNTQSRLDNIDRVEVNIQMPRKMVTHLIQYFPKMMDLHIYGGHIFDTACGSFPLNEQANVEYLRRVNLMEEKRRNSMNSFFSWPVLEITHAPNGE